MASGDKEPTGPDLSKGIPASNLPDGAMMAGHVGDDEVLLVRQSGKLFALSAHCTHYHGPLADGLVVGATIRCPWHHAHFDLETGEAIAAPALSPLTCWQVEERNGSVFVDAKKRSRRRRHPDRQTNALSLSAVAQPVLPPQRCCAAVGSPGASPCPATTKQPRSTARICRKTISPAARRKNGCRCVATLVRGKQDRSQTQNRSDCT